MARPRVRLTILCEDLAHEHFVRKLCESCGLSPVRIRVAPKGGGSAEAWVRNKYPDEVKILRAYGSENVALIVVTDGDKMGLALRKASLSKAMEEKGVPDRRAEEPISLIVPTWSIETWLLWLCGENALNEGESYKKTAKWNHAKPTPTPTTAVKAYVQGPRQGEAQTVPSLDDGRKEMARVLER